MLDVDLRFRRGPVEHACAFRTERPVTGIYGRSGAGKTTLLHLVAGLLRPNAGHVRAADVTLYDSAAGVDVPVHRRRVGVVFQDDRLLPHLNVRSNLRYGRPRGGDAPPLSEARVVEILELGALLGRRVHGLSGGERRRVALGRALLAAPRLLLLDEPLVSVDRAQRRRMLDLVARVRDETGVPMLLVSHDLAEILALTDHLVVVEAGRTVAAGAYRDVLRDTAAWHAVRELDPRNVLRLTVRSRDERGGLTELADAAGAFRLLAPPTGHAPGAVVTVTIRPADIALADRRLEGVSIRNQVEGRVVRVTAHDDRALIEVDAGVVLVVEVSLRTVETMRLAPDRPVWCLVKSNAVEFAD